MSLLRPFKAQDLFKFNNVNLDHWTETYSISFYLNYLSQWPDLSFIQTSPNPTSPRVMGYVIGKAEGNESDTRPPTLHGHVTAITIAPEYRRLNMAKGLMNLLEKVSQEVYRGYFVDLFVRPSNDNAVNMYQRLGYSVYRVVKEYYQGGGVGGKDEDGY
ncbi:acyl-CoA N-acyltransferase, partial [Violaceomyces palustris]